MSAVPKSQEEHGGFCVHGSIGVWAAIFSLRLYVIFDFRMRNLYPVIFVLLENIRSSFGLMRINVLSFLLVRLNVYIEATSRITLRFGLCRSSLQYPFMLVAENPCAWRKFIFVIRGVSPGIGFVTLYSTKLRDITCTSI